MCTLNAFVGGDMTYLSLGEVRVMGIFVEDAKLNLGNAR